ncbi:MAG: hypothetical protein HKL99_09785 [Burkholderiales bacterium]|jgi:hypothetical protein|nr:hypothetical protein [Burkholderiales bacterium]
MKNITADKYCHLMKVENRAECGMGWRIEDGGIFLNATRHGLEMLSTDELDAVTLGMGTRVLTVPLLAFPCSIGELHDFLLKLGEPGIDADDYAKAFRQNGRFTYTDDLPDGAHIPLSMWIQALAERAAVRRGIEPWSDDGWEFLNRLSRLVQDQSGTLPLRLLSSELLAQPPLDLLRDDYVVRKNEGLRWLAEHAQEFAEPVAQAEEWKQASPERKHELAIEALERHRTQAKAAETFGITRQRLATVLRNGNATVASSFPESTWKPHET